MANLHQLHAFGLLVKAPLCVTTPSSTVLCSASMIGLTIYGIKRPCVGNLSSRPTILSLKPNCFRWRRSAKRSPITSKIILQAGQTMRRVARCQGCHERGPQLRRPYIFSEIQVLLPSKGKGHDWTNDDGIGKRFPRRVEHAFGSGI